MCATLPTALAAAVIGGIILAVVAGIGLYVIWITGVRCTVKVASAHQVQSAGWWAITITGGIVMGISMLSFLHVFILEKTREVTLYYMCHVISYIS